MGILANENSIGGGNYLIERSLRFQSASSQSLSRTPASASNRKTYTWSGWVKRGAFSDGWLFAAGTSGTEYSGILLNATSNNILQFNAVTASTNRIVCTTAAVLRDPSAWYHLVIAVDTTQATNSNGVKMYINGTQQTLTFTAYTQNVDTAINNNVVQNVGSVLSTQYFDGYMAEVNFIDGQALTPSSFGETDALTGVWVAKRYTGTYGTNGFYLKFNDGTSTTTLGQDRSGNANNWTLTNFTRSAGVSDCWMLDVPSGNGSPSATQPSSNYCVLNPLNRDASASVTEANLKAIGSGTTNRNIFCTMAIPSNQKIYFEVNVVTGTSAGNYFTVGIAPSTLALNTEIGTVSGSFGITSDQANAAFKRISGTATSYGAGSQFATGNVLQVAIDQANGRIWFGKNNVWFDSGDPAAGTNPATSTVSTTVEYFPAVSTYTATPVLAANFGQRSFAYTPPSGFKALCTANLPAPTIAKGNQYMDISLYTGNAAARSITNSGGFQPDFLWIKSRSAGASNASNQTFNSVAGHGKVLYTDLTNAEFDSGTAWYTPTSNGFDLTSNAQLNTNTVTYAAWQWKAGSSTVTNTSGTISSQVRANTTAGFSIVTFTGNATAGATVGHGLGIAPKFVIYKARNNGNDWWSYHVGLTSAAYAIQLNTTNAQNNTVNFFNSTAPSASVLTLGYWNNATGFNLSTQNYVAYCFAEIAGFSKFGSYTGNGSTDGTFNYTGFRPKFVMIKCSSAVGSWVIFDSVRLGYNATENYLVPNSSGAEGTVAGFGIDILSNGFKIRTTDGTMNTNGGTYIYMAFAENPFSVSNAR